MKSLSSSISFELLVISPLLLSKVKVFCQVSEMDKNELRFLVTGLFLSS
jgi:hypothetical protein